MEATPKKCLQKRNAPSAYYSTFFSSSLLWRAFCLRQSNWNFNSFPVSVTGIFSPWSRKALANSITWKGKKNHNKTTTCIVLILHLTHIYLHAEMNKCYLTLYTCGLKWPHFQTKQCISKIHHYSLVPKTSNKVISATLCDKTRMEKTFYDLWESQQTQSSHRKM